MKNSILIPTDFTVSSLNLLKQALKNTESESQSYLLVFDAKSSDSITDLLFSSKSNLIESNTNDVFQEGLDILKNRYYDVINSIRIEPFYGFTKAAFRNFIDANNISEIYLPNDELLKKHSELKQICQYAQKLNVDKTIVNWQNENEEYASNQILQLFNS